MQTQSPTAVVLLIRSTTEIHCMFMASFREYVSAHDSVQEYCSFLAAQAHRNWTRTHLIALLGKACVTEKN